MYKILLYLNLVFVNEINNDPASKAFSVVKAYLEKNLSYGIKVDSVTVEGNRSETKLLLDDSK